MEEKKEISDIDIEEKNILFNKAYLEFRRFIIDSVIEYDKVYDIVNEEGVNLGDIAELDYSKLLPFDMNLRNIKIGKRESKYIIYVKEYPSYFEDYPIAKKAKIIGKLNELILNIFNKDEYKFIKIILPDIKFIDESNKDRVEKLRVNDIKLDNTLVFELNRYNDYPSKLSFIPDKIFLDVCQKNLNGKFYDLILKHYEFNDKKETLIIKNGIIDYYNDNNINVALMYLVNKLCKKKYSVKSFEMDKTFKKFILNGVDDINKFDEDNNEVVSLTSIFKEDILLDFLKNNKFKAEISIHSFIENIINDVEFLNYYNYSENVESDKNNAEMIKSFNRLMMNLRINRDELFHVESVKNSVKFTNILTLLISKFFNIYNEKNISKEMFMIVKADNQDIKKDTLKKRK